MQRDLQIDFVRGAGILMIAVDHLGYLAERFVPSGYINPFITWMRLGWSSAAEFFVFFSGYLTGLVYLKTLQVHGPAMLWARSGHRAWHIYAVNVLTLCAVVLLLRIPAFSSDELSRVTAMRALETDSSDSGLAAFLTLQSSPMFFEILFLYILLLLAAPVILLIARRSLIAACALSALAWFTAQLNPSLNIAQWGLNPLAWQLIFVLGMIGAIGGVFEKLRNAFSRQRLLAVSGGLLTAALLVKMFDKSGWSVPLLGPFDVRGIDKESLGPMRVLHFLVSVVFVMQIVPGHEIIRRALWARAVAGVGQRSLECFCLSTIAVYAVVGLLAQTDSFEVIPLLIGGGAIVVLLCLLAPMVQWIEAQPWRKSEGRPGQATIGRVISTSRSLTLRDVS